MLNIEDTRGKFMCGTESLVIDYRLRTDNSYDITGI